MAMAAGQGSTDHDILKQGYMMIKRPPSSGKVRIKAWQSKFFLLRDLSENSRQRLEYYKDQNTFHSAKSEKLRPKYCIFLDSVIHIGETRTSKTQPHAFMIVCTEQGALTLACNSEQSLKEWLSALNKVSVKVQSPGLPHQWPQESGNWSCDSAESSPELQRRCTVVCASASEADAATPAGQAYLVTTRLTPPAERNEIRGDHVMYITEQEVIVKSCGEAQMVVRWPLKFLKAFKNEPASLAGVKEKHLLTLQVGRRATTGEGIFQFFTNFGDEIIGLIRLHSNLVLQSTAADKREVFRKRAMSSGSAQVHSIQNSKSKTCVKEVSLPSKFGSSDSTSAANGPEETKEDKVRPLQRQGQVQASKSASTECEKEPCRKPRLPSATDSSEDDVFVNKSSPVSENLTDFESNDSPYIDLLPDEDAEPIHISDTEPRKGSCSSQASIVIGEDTKSTRRTMSSASCVSEDSELDSDGYLKSELLLTEEMLPRDKLCARLTLNLLSKETQAQAEIGPFRSPNDRTSRRSCEDLVTQTSNLTDHTIPPNVELPTRSLTLDSSFSPKPRSRTARASAAGSTFPPPDKDDANKHQELLDRILAQMELPQQNDVSDLFPNAASSQKRGSDDSVSIDKIEVSVDLQASGSQVTTTLNPELLRGHGLVEKRKSETGNGPKINASAGLCPPPLPTRPEVAAPRRTSHSALSDMDELRGKFDLTNSGNPTVFAKRMHKNASLLGGPRSIPKDVMVNARLLDLQSLFAKNSFLAPQNSGEKPKLAVAKSTERNFEVRECVSENVVIVRKTVETSENMMSSSEKTVLVTRSYEALDSKDEPRKRKDSKASKMVKRLFKITRSPPDSPYNAPRRRDSSDSYASEEWSEDDSERPRRHSLSPGFPMDVRFGHRSSEHTSPESSPIASRRKSREEKLRKSSKEEKERKNDKVSTDECEDKEQKGNACQSPRHFPCLSSQSVLEEDKDESAPALPPRKKSDPPPLPPRRPKSPSNPTRHRNSSTIGRPLLSCPTKDTKRFVAHRGPNTCQLRDKPPPPLPPRKENARSSSNATTKQLDEEGAPAMQPTSSPADTTGLSELSGASDDSTAQAEALSTEMDTEESSRISPADICEGCTVPARPPKGRNLGARRFLHEQTAVEETADRVGACRVEQTLSLTQEKTSVLNNNDEKSPICAFTVSSPETPPHKKNGPESDNCTVLIPDGKVCFVLEDSGHATDSSSSFPAAFSTEA